MGSIKSGARNALPTHWQVPIKYWYARMRGDLEPEMKLLDRLVSRGEHVVDIGGNRGVYAYSFWKLGARLDVFEPNPDCAGVLSAWAASKSGVAVHPVALSSCAGTAQLHVPVDDHGVEHDASASIEASHAGQTRDLDVELRPLDSFGFTDVSLIKIDVEGHETGVIEGALATLAASHPALIIEIEQRHNGRPIQEIFGRIEGLGYRGFFLKRGKLMPIAEFDLDRDQSMAAFGSASAEYLNNFIFLGNDRLGRGEYRTLLQIGGAGALG